MFHALAMHQYAMNIYDMHWLKGGIRSLANVSKVLLSLYRITRKPLTRIVNDPVVLVTTCYIYFVEFISKM